MKKIYNVKIEPLTAVHVGTGESLTPLDYKVYEMKLKNGGAKNIYAKFSSDKMLSRLIEEGSKSALHQFETASGSGNMKDLQKFFHANFKLDDLDYPCDVTKEFMKTYNAKISGKPVDNALEVFQMYRPAGKKTPVIPGSSIKGAIRTALLNLKMHNISDNEYNKLWENIGKIDKDFSQQKKYAKAEQPIQKNLFSFSDPKNDPFRTIAISDAEFSIKNTQAVGVLRNVSVDKKENELKEVGIQIMAEFLKGYLLNGESNASSRIIIDEGLARESNSRISCIFSMKDIISACNYFFKREFENEYEKFYKPCSDGLDLVLELKKQIDEISNQPNQFIFRVGRWSQAEFVTFEENFRRPKTRVRNGKEQGYGGTRTLLDYNGNFVPMGWCKCTVENLPEQENQ